MQTYGPVCWGQECPWWDTQGPHWGVWVLLGPDLVREKDFMACNWPLGPAWLAESLLCTASALGISILGAAFKKRFFPSPFPWVMGRAAPHIPCS